MYMYTTVTGQGFLTIGLCQLQSICLVSLSQDELENMKIGNSCIKDSEGRCELNGRCGAVPLQPASWRIQTPRRCRLCYSLFVEWFSGRSLHFIRVFILCNENSLNFLSIVTMLSNILLTEVLIDSFYSLSTFSFRGTANNKLQVELRFRSNDLPGLKEELGPTVNRICGQSVCYHHSGLYFILRRHLTMILPLFSKCRISRSRDIGIVHSSLQTQVCSIVCLNAKQDV